MKRNVLAAVFLLALCSSPALARVLEVFNLDAGRTDKNRIASPVWDAGAAEPVVVEPIASKLDSEYKVARRLSMRVPEFTVSPAIDLGRLLSAALQTEGTAMGLRIASPGTAGWTVSGTLDDVFVETRPIIYGPIMFYAYMKVALNVRRGGGEPRAVTYRLHNMYARANGGFGVQDEVSEVLANFLIDSAQEIMARLNRDFFQAPAHPSIKLRTDVLAASTLDDREAELRMIGFSGSREALPVLLALLAKEKDEGNRVYVLDALASLGAVEAVQPLAQRYAGEDEDCRFFILKAWDYIGGEEARSLILRNGPEDEDKACRSLAARLKAG
ncbi:MAG TPA: hypothetical protein VF756_30120 [Thermoanaerobaculia bacterium]